MKLIVHVYVFTREPLYGLTTDDKISVLYDPGTYGCVIGIGHECTVSHREGVQSHLQHHASHEITDIVGYPTSDGLTESHISIEGSLHRFCRETGVSPIVHDEIRKLWLSREPLILYTSDSEPQATCHS